MNPSDTKKLKAYKKAIQKVLTYHNYDKNVVESWGMDKELFESMNDGITAEDYAHNELQAAH